MAVEITGNIISGSEVKSALAIIPARAADLAKLEKVKQRVGINVILRGPHRSRQEEKFYRALVGHVADGLGMHPETLHHELKYKAGKIVRIVASDKFGTSVELKSSVAMDHAEFDRYVAAAIDILFSEYLPGVPRGPVLDEVRRMVKADSGEW